MNMKKLFRVGAVAAFCSATVAYSDIVVIWSGLDGFLRSDDATGLTEPANGSQNAYAQLILTPFNSYGEATTGGGVEAFELVLDTYVITDSGGTDDYGVLPGQTYVGAFSAGYLYARIYDQGTGNDPANNIGIGTWYYNGPLVATIDNPEPLSPDAYNVNGANPSITFGGVGDYLNMQVVPEPATFALLGLGGLALALRRRYKL